MATPTITLSLNYNNGPNVSIPFNGNDGYILAVTVTDPGDNNITDQGTYTYEISGQAVQIQNMGTNYTPSANVFTTAIGTAIITVTFTEKSGIGIPGQWAFTTQTIQVTVIKGTQFVNFSPVGPKTVGDAPVSLTAYVTGNDNARYGSISFVSTSPNIIGINDSTATFLSAGISQLQALAAANQYYNQGTSTPENVTVSGGGGGGAVPCFTAGTMIRVPSGEVAVETLRRGDLVVTAAGLVVPLTGCLKTRVAMTTKETAPYLIPAGTYGSTQPRDLVLSPTHAIQIRKGVWMPPFLAAR